MREDRISYRIDGYYVALAQFLVIEHPEPVSPLKAEEVHSPGIYVGEAQYQQRRHPFFKHILPQRMLYGHISILVLHCHRLVHLPYRIRLCAFEHHVAETVLPVDKVLKRIRPVICPVGIAHTQRPDIKRGVA